MASHGFPVLSLVKQSALHEAFWPGHAAPKGLFDANLSADADSIHLRPTSVRQMQ